MTLTFPFSQAMSVTRREFFIGTLLTAILGSLELAGPKIADQPRVQRLIDGM